MIVPHSFARWSSCRSGSSAAILAGRRRLRSARLLDRLFETLAQSALAQPAVFVHRDYHSRNLLVTDEANPGILDFQDAVRGAVTYDAVSLLKDCYIAWPRERVIGWLLGYRERLKRAGLDLGADDGEFIRCFDLMGLQRHIKVLGIFARLFYRDGKPGYLKDLPRVLAYTREAAALLSRDRRVRALHRRAHRSRFRGGASEGALASRRLGTEPLMAAVRARPRIAMILAAGRGERMRPLDRPGAEAASRGARQGAHRVSPRAPGARRHRASRRESRLARRDDP